MIIDQLRRTDSPLRVGQALPLMLVVAWVLFYISTFTGLLRRWTQWDQDLSYGLPLAAIFIYLLIKTLPWSGQPPRQRQFSLWLGATAACSLVWFAFRLVGISIFEQLMLIPLLVLGLTSLFGVRTIIRHRMLLLLPIFVIPVWGSLNGVLLNISSTVVGELVRLIGMPARIEGNSIFIPYGHILIADGCSGLRYFVISLLLGYLVAYLNRYTERGLLAVLVVAGTIGLIANWLRIFILILIGYGTQMQSSLMTDHEMFGWLLFAAMCLPALYFSPVVKAPVVKAPASKIAPPTQPPGPSWGRVGLVCGALAVGPVLSLAVNIQPSVGTIENYWNSTEAERGATLPVPVTAPANSHAEAVALSSGVLVQLDQYQRTSADDKLVPYLSYLYPQTQWLRENRGRILLDEHSASMSTASRSAVVTRHSPKANLSIFQRRDSQNYVAQLQWFEVGRYTATTVPWAKLLQIPAVMMRDNHFAILTVQTRCNERSCEDSLDALIAAAQELMAARARARAP